MANDYFQFKQFRIQQAISGMKVTTDGCLFGAWIAKQESGNRFQRILDIGTGTGILALMIAQKVDGHIRAIEIDNETSAEARENVSSSPWADRIVIENTSAQDFRTHDKYDLIVCNPPFFTGNTKGVESRKNQAVHADNLSPNSLANCVNKLLSKNGKCYVMYPSHEMKHFAELMKEKALFEVSTLVVRNQLDGSDFREIKTFAPHKEKHSSEELVIFDTPGIYSDRFEQLLHDYYL